MKYKKIFSNPKKVGTLNKWKIRGDKWNTNGKLEDLNKPCSKLFRNFAIFIIAKMEFKKKEGETNVMLFTKDAL